MNVPALTIHPPGQAAPTADPILLRRDAAVSAPA